MEVLKLNKENYLKVVYGNSKGWITKAEIKKGTYSQWHYKASELILMDFKSENTYITPNTFYKPYRRLECIKELNSLFIDLDYYKIGKTKDQIIMDLEDNYFNKKIPIPNFIMDSGRGLYLIWSIKKLPSMALPLWKAVQDYFWNQLKELGADRQALDATRILRVPGSINSKTNTVVSIIDEYKYEYELREIQEEYLPELKPKEKKKGRPNKVCFIYRERSLYYGRIQDIIKLCELREYHLKGHREVLLFLYRYYLCSFTEDTKKALDDVIELNRMFKNPLRENEVIRATQSAERCYLDNDKQYKYKNDTLIELLEITEEEQKHMKILISKEEYRRRDRVYQKKKYQEQLKAQGKINKKSEISQRREKIKDLLGKGLKRKDIYPLLNISLKTYKRDIQFLKEQGEI